METDDIDFIRGLSKDIIDVVQEGNEKLQEILERVECIDNSIDQLRDDAIEQIAYLKTIVQQGRP